MYLDTNYHIVAKLGKIMQEHCSFLYVFRLFSCFACL